MNWKMIVMLFLIQSIGYQIQLFSKQNSQTEEIFTSIFYANLWGGKESASGLGSDLDQTDKIRKEIPHLIQKFSIKSLLDAPCGDFWWMNHTDLSDLDLYIGIDIVAELIAKNKKLYGNETKLFLHKDIIADPLPKVDLILCRDCFVHLTFDQIFLALRNIKLSGSKYLLLTTFSGQQRNFDMANPGPWRALNLRREPFNFPEPLYLIYEGSPDRADKGLALWLIEDLPDF